MINEGKFVEKPVFFHYCYHFEKSLSSYDIIYALLLIAKKDARKYLNNVKNEQFVIMDSDPMFDPLNQIGIFLFKCEGEKK